jgi:NAD(P)-dependent dehydrogenase (short-subunit alcohol dehydrogenase family)
MNTVGSISSGGLTRPTRSGGPVPVVLFGSPRVGGLPDPCRGNHTGVTNQYSFSDPTTRYPRPPFEAQTQSAPGLAKQMDPKPDHGEDTYAGTGRLTGRVTVVTGADSGIGRAAAIAYAREGADVVLSYLPSEHADAAEVITLVEQAGQRAIDVPGDLRTEAACRELVDRTVAEFGRIDVLTIVAGEQKAFESIEDIPSDHFDSLMKTNIYAMFWLIKAAVAHIPPGGSIITTSSVQAYNPSPTLVDYAASKSAINTFSKSLAQQLGPKGIRVNIVAPGPVWTPLQISGGQPSDAIPDLGSQTPLGRPAQPAELAPAYVFLASAESSYVSGETLTVTGGMPTP